MAKQTFLIFLLIATLSACTKAELASVSTEAVLPAATMTAMQEPSVTPTQLPTNTATAINTTPHTTPSSTATQPVAPTATPKQTSLIEPTSVPVPSATAVSLDLPGWITEPSANILLLGNPKIQALSIFNVDTGEQHDIHMSENNLDPNWRWVFKSLDTSGDTLSPDGRYAVHTVSQGEKAGLATITDYETGIETELVNPFLHYQRLNEEFTEWAYASYWSPDGAFVSVLYDKHYYSDNYDRNLVIYTPSGEIFRQYANADTSWTNPWSPVLPYKILYTGNSYVPPCILDVIENKSTCLEVIDEWVKSQKVSPFHYIWSPDGNRISFVYGNSELTGLCYYELATNTLVCPVSNDDLWLDKQLFARIQFWSPDGKYLVLFFDKLGIMDVVGAQKVAVFNVDSQSFQILEGEYLWPSGDPWRPSIPSVTDK
ncbi:MAG: hypothetical protein IPM76_10070 [Chloroflexi bacterium]|nr:hypothetical protein [Chloroflexota bacterium]